MIDLFIFNKGRAEYKKEFPLKFGFFRSSAKTYDASPSYLYYPQCVSRISEFYPNSCFIVMMRDPVKRAYSAWNMFREMHSSGATYARKHFIDTLDAPEREALNNLLSGSDFPSFDEVITMEIENLDSPILEPSFVRRGIYHKHIRRYLEYFPRDRFLFIESDQSKNHGALTMEKVFSHLGVKAAKIRAKYAPYHSRSYSSLISIESRIKLQEFYKPHNERLYKLIGERYSW